MIEDAFEAQEAVFDTTVIAAQLMSTLVELAIDVRLSMPVRLAKVADNAIMLETPRGQIRTRHVVNATYAFLDGIGVPLRTPLKRELAEVVLVEPPPELLSFGITVIDGPFFSLLPFPPAKLHSLTHVRYTPHEARIDAPPDDVRPSRSNADAMIRDAARYLPRITRVRVIRSLFEWKAVLLQSEEHDDRPILLETSPISDRIVSVLGAKIDNIYDVRDAIRARRWDTMKASSISAVIVIEDLAVPETDLIRLVEALGNEWTDAELVLVANAVPTEIALELKQIIAAVPDSTCHFLSERIDRDAARVVGIDHAIGDHVLVTNATADELAALPKMIEAIHKGFDLVCAEPRRISDHEPRLYRFFRRLFYAAINALSDVELSPDLPPLRLMSRPAALHLVGQLNAELLLWARTLGPGYPASSVPVQVEVRRDRHVSFRRAITRGLRGLVTTSAAPLRIASLLGLASALMAFLYTFYVIGVFLFKSEVAPGWTTLSLQLAGMMLLLSFILALIAEYVLQIHARMPLRRRAGITREIKSPLTRRAGRTNVITDGSFMIGMPSDLIASNSVRTERHG